MGTALSIAGVFLVALSPLLVAAALVRLWHWVGPGGRHRRRGPARGRADRRTGGTTERSRSRSDK